MKKNLQAQKSIKKIDQILPQIIEIEDQLRKMPIENGYDIRTQMVITDIEEIEKKLVLNRMAATEALYVK